MSENLKDIEGVFFEKVSVNEDLGAIKKRGERS
jgi:hypothetical protein